MRRDLLGRAQGVVLIFSGAREGDDHGYPGRYPKRHSVSVHRYGDDLMRMGCDHFRQGRREGLIAAIIGGIATAVLAPGAFMTYFVLLGFAL